MDSVVERSRIACLGFDECTVTTYEFSSLPLAYAQLRAKFNRAIIPYCSPVDATSSFLQAWYVEANFLGKIFAALLRGEGQIFAKIPSSSSLWQNIFGGLRKELLVVYIPH